MCGIAGCWRSEWDVDAALDLIAHRGPDARATRAAGDALHGHVRLSILDPDPRSNQPFVYEGITLSYVGECWNYQSVRAELERLGCEFRTEGDTEVVAAALYAWGSLALQKLHGQFAFAWTDADSGQTWLARDRFGEVPLYVLRRTGGDLFSSGVDGVMWASERKAFGQDFGGEAYPVPAGHVWMMGEAYSLPYYLPEENVLFHGGGDPAERVRLELEEAVRLRLQADVPVCCLISGGLDSTAILALVKQIKPDVHAYVAAIEGVPSPDLDAAIEVSRELEVPLTVVHVDPPDEAALRAAIYAIETPMKAQVEIASLCLPLARAIAAGGFKVVLSGEGADELFGGYGNLARKATYDALWRDARLQQVDKMARGNFLRTNKAFMAYGVEARCPFFDRPLVERVLGYGLKDCPPGKGLLKEAVADLVPDFIRKREKMTFQGAAGAIEHMTRLTGGAQVKTYNNVARELFGALPRG